MSFARAVAFVLQQEGPLHEDPHDPGGLTAWGIALARHPELTADDIRAMTPERAAQLYNSQYWDAIHGDELPQDLQLPMLDTAVLQGSPDAVHCLQNALGIVSDGIIGPGTLGAARRAAVVPLLASFTAERIAHFSALPTWGRYGRGWANRAVRAALEAIQ